MRFSVEETEILDMATEDIYGLWEAEWGLRRLLPGWDNEALHELARRTVQRLFGQGLLRVSVYSPESDSERLISDEEVELALNDRSSWAPSGPLRDHVVFAATKRGHIEFNSREA